MRIVNLHQIKLEEEMQIRKDPSLLSM